MSEGPEHLEIVPEGMFDEIATFCREWRMRLLAEARASQAGQRTSGQSNSIAALARQALKTLEIERRCFEPPFVPTSPTLARISEHTEKPPEN